MILLLDSRRGRAVCVSVYLFLRSSHTILNVSRAAAINETDCDKDSYGEDIQRTKSIWSDALQSSSECRKPMWYELAEIMVWITWAPNLLYSGRIFLRRLN